MRILCLDIGDVRVGVAISDPLNIIAQPLITIDLRKMDLVAELDRFVKDYNIGKIVIGYPMRKTHIEEKNEKLLKLDGLVEKLSKRYNIEVVKWDERFSTKAVERILDENLDWRKKKKIVDKLAATYILQGYLDYINS